MAAFSGKVGTGLPLENAHFKMRVFFKDARILSAKPVPTFAE
jgi:hypothetical protein